MRGDTEQEAFALQLVWFFNISPFCAKGAVWPPGFIRSALPKNIHGNQVMEYGKGKEPPFLGSFCNCRPHSGAVFVGQSVQANGCQLTHLVK